MGSQWKLPGCGSRPTSIRIRYRLFDEHGSAESVDALSRAKATNGKTLSMKHGDTLFASWAGSSSIRGKKQDHVDSMKTLDEDSIS